MKSETSEKLKEVTDFVASDLPDQSLPSEKDMMTEQVILNAMHSGNLSIYGLDARLVLV